MYSLLLISGVLVFDQHIKNPSKLKTGLEGHSFKRDNTAHQKHRFFYSVGLSYLWLYKNRADKLWFHFTSSSALRLSVWLYNCYFLFCHIDYTFLFTLRTEQRKVYQLCIFSYFSSSFIFANRAIHPFHIPQPPFYSSVSIYSSKHIPWEYISKAASFPTYL